MMTYNLSALPLTYPSILITAILIGRLSLLSHIAASSLVAFACKPSLAKKRLIYYLFFLKLQMTSFKTPLNCHLWHRSQFFSVLIWKWAWGNTALTATSDAYISTMSDGWNDWKIPKRSWFLHIKWKKKTKLPLSFIICLLCASSLWKRTCLHKKATATMLQQHWHRAVQTTWLVEWNASTMTRAMVLLEPTAGKYNTLKAFLLWHCCSSFANCWSWRNYLNWWKECSVSSVDPPFFSHSFFSSSQCLCILL